MQTTSSARIEASIQPTLESLIRFRRLDIDSVPPMYGKLILLVFLFRFSFDMLDK